MSIVTPSFETSAHVVVPVVAPVVTTPRTPPRATTRRRVLHVINGEHYAGAERVQDLLALRLPRLGFQVSFACLKPGEFARSRQSHSSTIYDVPMWHRYDLLPALKLAKLARSEHFEIIHTHTPRSALVGSMAARLAGVPWVHHVHSPALADTTHALRNRANAIVERCLLRRADALVAVSQSLGQYVEAQRLGSDRPRVIPNGVRTRGPLSPRQTPTTRWTLGAVALFRPRKGLEVLLHAMSSLAAEGYDVHLHAVGKFESPKYEAEIKRVAVELGLESRIEWRGFQRNVDGELANVDVFVLPSLFGEGMPMVLLEAMAGGVPVVATRVEGVEELIDDGASGVIVEPGSAASLTHGLRRILDRQLDWQSLRAAALGRQVAEYSDLAMARRIADLYRELLDVRA